MTAPMFTTGATYFAGDAAAAGVDAAAAGGAGALAAAAPIAIPAAIAAYAFSPTVRKYVNGQGQRLMGGVSKLGQGFMNGLNGTLDPGAGQSNGFMSRLMGQQSNPSQQLNPMQNQAGSQAGGMGEPTPPHALGQINLPSWAPNPNDTFTNMPAMPQRRFY